MSDYARQYNFNSKTGTIIYGSEVDDEFNAALTAINSKVDESREAAASGIATLDGSALIPVAQLPAATEVAIGAVELASTAEAVTGTDTTRAVTAAGVEAVLENAGGMLGDIKDLANPAADTLLGWDNSATAVINYTLGEGLTSSLTAIKVDLSEIGTVAIAAADTIPFYDADGAVNGKTTFSLLEAALNHDSLAGFVAAEHYDWSADQGATNIHVNNITEAAVTQHQAALSITESQISDMPVTVSQAVAEAGTDTTDTLWTAQRVAQAIAALETGSSVASDEGCKLTRSTGTTFGGVAETWDVEIYDTNGFHEGVTNPSRITIPTGVTKVRLVAHIESGTSQDNGALITIKFQKNGAAGTIDDAATSFQPKGQMAIGAEGDGVIDLDTGIITVAAGDYFELLTTETNPTLPVDFNAYVSWISCEVIA